MHHKQQILDKKTARWLTGAMLLLAVVLFTFSIRDVQKRLLFVHEKGVFTHGVVGPISHMAVNKNRQLDCCTYVYYVGKQLFRSKICDCPYQEGDTLTIRYNPNNGQEHEIYKP